MTNQNPGYLRLIRIFALFFLLNLVNAQNVISFYPERNSTDVEADTQIEVYFDSTIDQNTIGRESFIVHGSYSGFASGQYNYDAFNRKAVFSADKPFLINEVVLVTVTKRLLFENGDSLQTAFSWSFQIKPKTGLKKLVKMKKFSAIGANGIKLFDSNADGYPEIISIGSVSKESKIYKKDDQGNYLLHSTFNGKLKFIKDFIPNNGPDLFSFFSQPNFPFDDNYGFLLYKNDGAGSFSLNYTFIDMVTYKTQIVSLDLDLDGDFDIIYSPNKWINKSNSSSAFFHLADYNYEKYLNGLTIDIDYDGAIDIVQKDGRIMINDRNGDFTESSTIPGNYGFQFVNINSDTDLELLCLYKNTNTIKIFTYDSLFNFTEYSSIQLTKRQKGMTLADANGDGLLDLFVFYEYAPEIDLFLNTGSGIFQYNTTVFTSNRILGVAAGDLDYDGDLDLACLLKSSLDVEIFNNTENYPLIGLSQDHFYFGMIRLNQSKTDTLKICNYSYASDLIVEKLETKLDEFTINLQNTIIHPGNTLNILISFAPSGIQSYRDTLTILCNDPLSPIKKIPLSGDGGSFDVDVTPAHHSIITVKPEFQIKFNFDLDQRTLNNGLFLRGNQSGTQKNWQLTYSQTTRIATFRTNSDFLAGEKVTLSLSSRITSRINTPFDPATLSFTVNTTETGNGFFKKLSALPVENIKKVYPADLNNDGFTDLVAVRNDKKISVLLNNGSGSFTLSESINHYGKDQPPFVTIADFDNDGDVDIAAIEQEYAGRMDDYIRIYLNDGQGLFQNKQISTHIGQCTYSTGIYARDINQDGFVDVATLGMSDAFVIYINEGTAHFQSLNYVSILERTASRLKFADWDNDYDFDLTDHKGKLFENKNGHFKYNKDLGLEVKNLDFADFDGDNDLDLATVSGQLNIWSNDGSGTFSQTDQVNLRSPADLIIPADFDGDNDMDIVVAKVGSDKIKLSKNSGNGTFSQFDLQYTDSLQYLACADFTGDGDIDLALVSAGSDSLIILENKKGSFQEEHIFVDSLKLMAEQINENGSIIEVHFSDSVNTFSMNNNSVNIFGSFSGLNSIGNLSFGQGNKKVQLITDKKFWPGEDVSVSLSSGIKSISGKLLDPATFRIKPALLPSSGAFLHVSSVDAGNGPYGMASADFDGDGDLDLVISNRSVEHGAQVLLLRNSGGGMFVKWDSLKTLSGNVSCTAGDFDNDGDIDIAVANYWSYNVSLFINDGSGGFTAAGVFNVGKRPSVIKCTDINSDTYLDLIIINEFRSSVSILLNNGDASFSSVPEHNISGWGDDFNIIDFNADGKPDIAIVDQSKITIYINYGKGLVFDPLYEVNQNPFPSAKIFCSADIDGDGDIDIVSNSVSSFSIDVFLFDGEDEFEFIGEIGNDKEIEALACRDIDGDGDLDVLVISNDNDQGLLSIYKNNGKADFVKADQIQIGKFLTAIHFSDFNRDGAIDIALSDYASNKVEILLNHQIQIVTSLESESIDFGIASVGDISKNTFYIRNATNRRIKIDSLVCTNNAFIAKISKEVILGGDSAAVTVLFSPDSDSLFSGQLIVNYSGTIQGNIIMNLNGSGIIGGDYKLLQNYPNPFNNRTKIKYVLPLRSNICINVYDALGQRIKRLVDKSQDTGLYSIEWDGKNEYGNAVSSGIYFYRIRISGSGSNFVKTRKMLLLK